MSEVNYVRQDIHYLGFLETQLRGLGGIDTMVYELIQNADDVHTEAGQPGASRITFDVCDDALLVENDGVFRKEDFQRMQRLAGGAKRHEANTTGAFGIGFISVYQVTDAPEILSSDRRWVIHPEEEDPARRIHETQARTQHTVFRLPWADDPRSAVRRDLHLAPVDRSKLDAMADRIAEAACGSALFLRQIERLEVRRNGKPVQTVRRDPGPAAGTVDLFLSGHVADLQSWSIFDLDYADRAAELRERHPVQVESVRHTRVQLAVGARASQSGRLYATLPTNTTFDLPFSINADFFPTPDRKSILFGEDYQGEWNRAAIEAAAAGLDEHLEAVRDLVGAASFVGMLDRVQVLYSSPDDRKPDRSFDAFWEALAPTLSERAVVYTVDGAWVRPYEARLPQGKAALEATGLLSQLGLQIVCPKLARFSNILTHRDVGTPLLSIRDVLDLLDSSGVQAGMRPGDCPQPLRRQESWTRLWDTLEELLEPSRLQRNSTDESTETARLSCAPIALDGSGVLQEARSLFRADGDTRQLFPLVPWLADDNPAHPLLTRLVPSFGPSEAIAHLLDLGVGALEGLWQSGRLSLPCLYAWLSRFVDFYRLIPYLARDFRKLPVWPSSGRLLSIDELFIPTGFDDPLGIASLVDTKLIEGYVDLARRMDMRELDLRTYAAEVVPDWLREHPEGSADARRALVRLLAERLGQIRDDSEVQRTLSALPLIECTDGSYGSPSEVYADNENTQLLGPTVRQALRWYGQSDAIDDLYAWLGVAEDPRPHDLVASVRDRLPHSRDDEHTLWVQRLFTHLSRRWSGLPEEDKRELLPLRTLAWLPGTRDSTSWYVPSDLYAVFQEYLFSSQGSFLALERSVQREGAAFMNWLQVRGGPPTALVVRHLIHCCERGIPVNSEVYVFLDQHVDEPEVKWLCGKPCILTREGQYIDARRAFWHDNPYGEYRITLSTDDRKYVKLFGLLGVRDGPEDQDHIDVLLDVAARIGTYARELDDQSYAVVLRCWQLLSDSIRQGSLDPRTLGDLKQQKVAPNRDKYLQVPERLFMEDRPHIADHFREALGPSLVARPAGAWAALHAAGVRRLSDAIRVEMLDAVDSTDDPVLTERLRERLPLVARVVEGVRQDAEVREAASLTELQARRASSLLARYALPIGSRSMYSHPVNLSVLVEGSTLYVVDSGVMPWAAIARELAYILKPDGEVTSLAPGLKEALAYSTLEEASQALDQLDIPPLAEAAAAIEAAAPTLTVAGTETQYAEYGQPYLSSDKDHGEASKGPEQVATGGIGHTALPDVPQEPPFVGLPGEPDAHPTFSVVEQRPSERTPSGLTLPPSSLERGAGGRSRDTRRRSEERLVSYVLPEGEGSREPDAARVERLGTVEDAGIGAAVRHEERAGRKAKVQDHLNRGYDIVSRGADGSRRYIEVKALSGTWDARNPVRLTPAEMEEAQRQQGAYWLYVVEHALGSEPVLFCIQNPAARVHRYCFDHGWMGVAEHIPAASSAPDPEEAP